MDAALFGAAVVGDFIMAVAVIYRVPVPYGRVGDVIEVYGDPEMIWYDFRVLRGMFIVADSDGTAYGCAEIALRDALVYVTKDFS